MLAIPFLLALMATTPETRVVEVKVGPVQREILKASERFTDIEGAMRSSKTWTILIKLRRVVEDHPGIAIAISRWTEGDLNQKLVPDFRRVCELLGVSHGAWNAKESCYDFPCQDCGAVHDEYTAETTGCQVGGSRVYCVHLKTSQKDNRFAQVRGLTVAIFYIDQLEEVPEDVYNEAAMRLSQPGFPQQMIVSPNPVPETHWIARRWPIDNRVKSHRYLRATIWDNRHNLDPQTIQAAEELYPVGHPQRRTKLEGKRGLDVSGTPVYTGAFMRSRHVRALEINQELPLHESYDYGYHRPCIVFYQYAPWGWVRVLGGVMGADMHLDAFLQVAERYRNLWFPHRLRIDATCDPAGAAENSQGLRGTPVQILRDWYREHGERDADDKFVVPLVIPNANHPEKRDAAVKLLATYMRRHVNGDEAFLVDPERWVLAELGDERQDTFFIDGLEVGYVLEAEPRHSTRLGSFWLPKKDKFYEHPMNCLEYGALAHVRELPLSGQRANEALVRHDVQRAKQERARLKRDQADHDDPHPAAGISIRKRGFSRGPWRRIGR